MHLGQVHRNRFAIAASYREGRKNMNAATILSSKRTRLFGKSLFAGVWIACIIAVLLALSFEDRYFSVTGQSVATIAQANREVTVRSEDDLRWRAAKSKQSIYDGDKVATGPASEATIDFGEGRKGVLGPDSVIAITTIKQSQGNSFILNLIKGGIKPIVPKNSKAQLIVTSGTSTFYVEPGESKGFAKPVGGTIREFNSRERFPVVTHKVAAAQPVPTAPKFVLPVALVQVVEKLPAVEVQKLPPPKPIEIPPVNETAPEPVASLAPPVETLPTTAPAATEQPVVKSVVPEKLAEKPAEKPVEVPSPQAVAKATDLAGLMPSIDDGSLPIEQFTLSSLKEFAGTVAKVRLKSSVSKNASAEQGLQVQIGDRKTFVKASNQQVLVQVNRGQLTATGSSGVIPCAELVLKGMVQLTKNGQSQQSTQPAGKTLKVCSLADVASKVPLTLSLKQLGTQNTSLDLFTAPSTAQNFGMQILLTRAADFKKLLPYVRSATSFKVAKASSMSSTGIFGVIDGKVVAEFSGAAFTPQIIDSIMKTMGYSMVYKGSRKAIYDASGLNPEKFQSWIFDNTSEGKKVYMPMRGNLVPVSRDFMSQRSEVAEFVQRSSKTLVTEKIEIITYQAEK